MQSLHRMQARVSRMALKMAAVVALLAPIPAAAQELELRTRLAGGAIEGLRPSGHADYRQRPGERRFSTEVEDVNLPAGTILVVFISRDGMESRVGRIVLGPPPVRGGDLNLDTRDGDAVPVLRAGTVVIVREQDGTAVLAGVLRRRR